MTANPDSQPAGNTYTNDLDGSLTGPVGETLVWDALRRLTQVADGKDVSVGGQPRGKYG